MSSEFQDDAAVEELLGAYALDALEPDELHAVDSLLARDPNAAAEVTRLRNAAAWVGATEALTPPRVLRERVLRAARTARSATDALPGIELYRTEVDRAREAIEALTADAEPSITANGLTARDLVTHLAAMESMFAATVGDPTVPEIDSMDVDERTAQCVERFRSLTVEEITDLWQHSVDTVCRRVRSQGPREVQWLSFNLAVDDLLVTRGFETWVHGDDLRRVLGRPETAPSIEHVRTMSALAMQLVGPSMTVSGCAHPGKTARIVLTGPAGATFDVGLSADTIASSMPDVVVTTDVVEYCRLVADRRTPAALHYRAEGQVDLVPDILAAASTFSHL